MGFNSVNSTVSKRNTWRLGAEITIFRNGTGSVLFFHGAQAFDNYRMMRNALDMSSKRTKADQDDMCNEYDEDIRTIEADGEIVPYLTTSNYKIAQAFAWIAWNRAINCAWFKGKTGGARREWAQRLGAIWLRWLPNEDNDLYVARQTESEIDHEFAANFANT